MMDLCVKDANVGVRVDWCSISDNDGNVLSVSFKQSSHDDAEGCR